MSDKFAFYRIFYNVFSLITVLPLFYLQMNIPGPVARLDARLVIKLSPVLLLFKYIVLVLSAVIIAGAFFTFNVFEFLGIRQIMDRKQKTEKTSVIFKHGFYGIVRHPMYFGGFMFFTALMMHAPIAQFLGHGILAVYMVIGAIREDRRLANELGDVYREYQREISMFLPKSLFRKFF